jgi:hypothetical protein
LYTQTASSRRTQDPAAFFAVVPPCTLGKKYDNFVRPLSGG